MTTSTMGGNPQRPGIWSDLYIPDQLIAGTLQLVTETITLAAGQLPRGALLGRREDGAYVLSKKTAKDGSQQPVAILADEADARNTPVSAGVYLMGEFNQDALYMPNETGWTIEEVKPLLRAVSIFLKCPVSATDPS
ncbi:conserved phage-related protein [Candidatus Glomeribacter gigasporarum BEG34]|uniref:Conserved phage-related protein n=1 Tax=Candidatus Glomeribacter gigasporarum BEG34 TaxID=1070319 RepID=G2JBU8_9BURK|nr:head decoration protein [Candidatus Glomeribacter gigasporarum]CCD30253.1 conserved phage-related protein [Candidatus Glomeribacter gigasporarum BEG34]